MFRWESTEIAKHDTDQRFRERKVALFVHVEHLKLSGRSEHKLIQLAGRRYDPETRILKIVSEQYPTQAENRLQALAFLRRLLIEANVSDAY